MKREVYIISGFLGSGKTTLIQKMLRESLKGQNIALIEYQLNDLKKSLLNNKIKVNNITPINTIVPPGFNLK